LRWFADEAIDVAVVEVGLGGTWDATNVIDGRVAVVTNVSVDHVAYLGSTHAEIATEKAGIIKEGATLVLGETDPDLVPIFTARGAARVLQRDVDFGLRSNVPAFGGRMLELFTPGAGYPDVFVPLHGAHQGDNAAAALAAAEAFVGAPIDPEAVRGAFSRVRSPGRLELVGRHPLVLLDGAHNVAGAVALRKALTEEFAPAPRTLVVGLLREKEPRDMLRALGLDDVEQLVCARPPNARALDPTLIANAAVELGFPPDRIDVVDSVSEAVSSALLTTPPEGEIIVTGSLYFVGAARSMLVDH
jgi:dihydrofolate synthase / folylpolyglutamate synthase